MSKRTVEDIQSDFNELGSRLLQCELGIERFKEALTNANNEKNKLLQKLINLDNEFQKLKYSELQVSDKLQGDKDGNVPQAEAPVPSSPSANETPAG